MWFALPLAWGSASAPRGAAGLAEAVVLATDPAGQLDVLGLDGDALCVDGTEVGVLEEMDEEGLGCLLQRKDGVYLPTERGPRVHLLRHLPDDALITIYQVNREG